MSMMQQDSEYPEDHDAGDEHAGVDDMSAPGGDDMVDGDDSMPPEDDHTTALATTDDGAGDGMVDEHGDGAVDDHGADGAVGAHDDAAELDKEDEPITSAQVKGLHGKMDGNGDGVVSLEELSAFSETVKSPMAKKETEMGLQQIDANSDGKISLDELLEANFGKIEDHEHGMSKEEEAAFNEKMAKDKELEIEKFKLADANKDTFLDKDELTTVLYPEVHKEMLELVVKASFKPKDKDGDGLLTPEEFWGLASEETGDTGDHSAEFKKLDTDNDGKLNLQEVMTWESGAHHHHSALLHIFEVADKDKNGLSLKELDDARESLHDSIASQHLMSWAEHHEL